MKEFDFIILGAGISGLTLLNKFKEYGISNIVCLEKENEAGGLCRSFEVNGHYVDIGGHFFQTKYKEVEDFIFSLFPKEKFYRIDPRISKIKIHDLNIDYPLESNLWQFPIELQVKYLISVIRNGESLNKPVPKNYEEWVRWKLGNLICDNYMIPYNTKLWGCKPNELDVDWLYKIPRVEVEDVLTYSLQHKQDVSKYPCHSTPYYPKSGGYGEVMKAVSKPVLDKIKLNYEIESIHYNEFKKTWVVNNELETKNLITTIPWPDLFKFIEVPSELVEDVKKIKYNKVVISLFEVDNYDNNWHWRYRPELNISHHRELYINNFVKDSKKYGIFTETNSERFDLKKIDIKGNNIFNYTTPAAYPLPIIGRTKAIDNILRYYKRINLFGIGRWGEHLHLNHDVCMKHCIDFVNNIAK